MVDVGGKTPTARQARASAVVTMRPETLREVMGGTTPKGPALEVARVAGILAAKRTPDLIPLCHPIPIDSVQVEFEAASESRVRIEGTVKATHRTGVEMEALTAVSVAALTLYDMCKSIDRDIEIGPIALEYKKGGTSGPTSGS
jgi:cyclic pyranopterin phosphate synthase